MRLTNFINKIIYNHLSSERDYQEICKQSGMDENLMKDGTISVIPYQIKLEKVKAILNDLSSCKLLQNTMSTKVITPKVNLEGNAAQWASCANTICQLIAFSTFWKLGNTCPYMEMLDTIIKLNGTLIDSQEINKLCNNNDDYCYYMFSLKHNLNCVFERKLDFSSAKSLIENSSVYLMEFNQMKSEMNYVNKFDSIGRMMEMNKEHTQGFTPSGGQETYISRMGHKTLRDVVATNMHELAHAYLRQTGTCRNPLEEGLCEYVSWWTLVNVMSLDERTANSYISKVAQYKEGFEKIKSMYGNNANLSDVIQHYSSKIAAGEKE